MSECHRCRHAADVAAGKYSVVPWEETPCAACALREYSVGTLPFDEERPAAGGREQGEACGTVAWSCTTRVRPCQLHSVARASSAGPVRRSSAWWSPTTARCRKSRPRRFESRSAQSRRSERDSSWTSTL